MFNLASQQSGKGIILYSIAFIFSLLIPILNDRRALKVYREDESLLNLPSIYSAMPTCILSIFLIIIMYIFPSLVNFWSWAFITKENLPKLF